MSSYEGVHQRLRDEHGRASEHLCVDCGKQARDWSYDHGAEAEKLDERGWPYDPTGQAYSPRCSPCHTAHDNRDGSRGRRGGLARNEALGPEGIRRIAKLGHAARRASLTDEEFTEFQRQASRARWSRVIDVDAELRPMREAHTPETLRAGGRKTGKMRRRCNDCGLVTSPGPLGRHQRATGHTGFTPATV